MVVIYVIEVIITTLSLFCHGKTTRVASRGAVGWKNEGKYSFSWGALSISGQQAQLSMPGGRWEVYLLVLGRKGKIIEGFTGTEH